MKVESPGPRPGGAQVRVVRRHLLLPPQNPSATTPPGSQPGWTDGRTDVGCSGSAPINSDGSRRSGLVTQHHTHTKPASAHTPGVTCVSCIFVCFFNKKKSKLMQIFFAPSYFADALISHRRVLQILPKKRFFFNFDLLDPSTSLHKTAATSKFKGAAKGCEKEKK